MNQNFSNSSVLFSEISDRDMKTLLDCLCARRKSYAKGDIILSAGEVAESMGLVLSGAVNIESVDIWGGRSILGHVKEGELFAETYACLKNEPLMVSAVAALPSEVLFLSAERVLHACPASCGFHSKLIENFIEVMARKNLNLSMRIFHTAPKTIRERLVSYLSFLATEQGKSCVTVPFNRQQLADYLGVDRSAMSSELGKMQDDGLISVSKNDFTLHQMP